LHSPIQMEKTFDADLIKSILAARPLNCKHVTGLRELLAEPD
jgi:hypothetical protein